MNETVSRLQAFGARRAVEIGCGTGLLLTRLAGACQSYIGVDFSAEVVSRLGAYVEQREDLRHVELRQGLAPALSFVPDDSCDLVILNSVIQYFPDLDYLLKVLSETVRITKEGGHIFVGDARSLPLLEAYHASVQLHKAPDELSIGELQ